VLSKYLKTLLNGGVPEEERDPLKEGLAAFEAGDYEQALALFEEVLASDPHQLQVLTAKGRILNEQGSYAEAYQALSAAVELDAYNPQIYYYLGEVLYAQQDLFAAERHFAKAAQLDPDYTDAFIREGMVLAELGRREEAVKAFERAIFLDRAAVVARFHLAQVCLQMEDFRRALAQLHMVKELYPEYAPVYLLQGEIQQRLGDLRQAIVEYDKAVELGAGDAGVFWQLGQMHLSLGDRENALKAFVQVVEYDPEHWPAHYHVAVMHDEAKRYGSAQQSYQALLQSEEYREVAQQAMARISAILAEIAASMAGDFGS
jgi:tetratricopeptide (TPR) repeat protein